MRENKVMERLALAKAPRLVSTLPIDSVHDYGGRGIEKTDCNGDLVIQSSIVDMERNSEWTGEGSSVGWRGYSEREWVWRKLEQLPWRQLELELRTRHDCRIEQSTLKTVSGFHRGRISK